MLCSLDRLDITNTNLCCNVLFNFTVLSCLFPLNVVASEQPRPLHKHDKHRLNLKSCNIFCFVLGQKAHGESRGGRFQNVTELRLAGLDLTAVTSRLLVRYLPHLTKLDLSQCGNITDQTIHTLTSPMSPLKDSLAHLNPAGKDYPVDSLAPKTPR